MRNDTVATPDLRPIGAFETGRPLAASSHLRALVALQIAVCLAALLFALSGCRSTANSRTEPAATPKQPVAVDEGEDEEPLPPLPPLPEEQAAGAGVGDPLEGWNRVVFHVNDKLYFWVFKPLAQGYSFVVPQGARRGVRNFFTNLSTPVRAVNALFQLKFRQAGTELKRFGINTTVGVLGFGDPARHKWNILRHQEDLGQTLGHYGVEPGFFINWPLFGPSNIRDSVGSMGDWFLEPITWVTIGFWENIALRCYRDTNTVSLRIGDYETLKKGSLDPYVAIRDAYHQHREHMIKDEKEEGTRKLIR